MTTRYGCISEEQISYQQKKLHNAIHWMLVYKENDYPYLDTYIQSVLFRLNGLSSLLCNPIPLVDLMILLESARLELKKEDFNFKLYRKAILDSHKLIDLLMEDDCNA